MQRAAPLHPQGLIPIIMSWFFSPVLTSIGMSQHEAAAHCQLQPSVPPCPDCSLRLPLFQHPHCGAAVSPLHWSAACEGLQAGQYRPASLAYACPLLSLAAHACPQLGPAMVPAGVRTACSCPTGPCPICPCSPLLFVCILCWSKGRKPLSPVRPPAAWPWAAAEPPVRRAAPPAASPQGSSFDDDKLAWVAAITAVAMGLAVGAVMMPIIRYRSGRNFAGCASVGPCVCRPCCCLSGGTVRRGCWAAPAGLAPTTYLRPAPALVWLQVQQP